jgi:N-acetylneuraminic acid mutarotase
MKPLQKLLQLLFVCFFSLYASAQNFSAIYWTTAASQPFPVYEAQGEVVNGKLFTFSGFDNQKIAQGYWTPTDRAYMFNPATNSWTSLAKMPAMNNTGYGGVTHAGFTTDSVDIYFSGGYTSNSTGTGQIFGTKEVWKYIVAENRYTRLPDLPKALASGQLEYVNKRLHHVGGFPGNPNTTVEVSDHYVLDLTNVAAGWKTLAPLTALRNHAGATVLGGKIYIIGGQRGNDHTSVPLRDGHSYNPATNSWTRIADMPVPAGTTGRAHISSSVIVVGNRIVVIGGETSHNVRTNLVSAYSPATNTWQNLTGFPKSIAGGVAGSISGTTYYTGGPNSAATYKGLPAQNTTLAAAADAYVRNGTYANANFGKDTALHIKGSASTGYTRYFYIKFSLGTIQNPYSAKLRVYGRNNENTSSIVISAYGATNDSWVETSITHNNAPAVTTTVIGTVSVNNVAKYYDIDVTSFVKSQLAGDKIVTILVKDASNQNRYLSFRSREHTANKPQLLVQTPYTGTAATLQSVEYEEGTYNGVLSVFPNPAKNRLHLTLPHDLNGECAIDVTDIAGRSKGSIKMNVPAAVKTIPVDLRLFSLTPGIYLIRISSAQKRHSALLMIE